MTEDYHHWKSVAKLNNRDNEKTRGWLIPKQDFIKLTQKIFEQKVLTIRIDDKERQEMVLSNYKPDKKKKILRKTEQVVFSIDDRSYKLTPVIYYEKEKQRIEYIPRTKEGIEAVFTKGKGVQKCGKKYIAFMYKNRVINVNEMNIFISL